MILGSPAAYIDNAHFRVPADFMPMVHLTASSQGLTAASFMRMAIIQAMQRSGVAYATEEQD
jgi:hypothetical protein